MSQSSLATNKEIIVEEKPVRDSLESFFDIDSVESEYQNLNKQCDLVIEKVKNKKSKKRT